MTVFDLGDFWKSDRVFFGKNVFLEFLLINVVNPEIDTVHFQHFLGYIAVDIKMNATL